MNSPRKIDATGRIARVLATPLAIAVPIVLAAALYAPAFNGFWLGDDGTNLHRAYVLAQHGRLLPETLRYFVSSPSPTGAFYRPLAMTSFALNYVVAHAHYAGWFALNFAVHLANVGLLALVVRRLGERVGCDARVSAVVAALLFGLAPFTAEAVYWISARSDGWVVLFSLLAMYVWASNDSGSRRAAFALPALLVLALGFKESAAVLPLQMALVAWAWPAPRPRSHVIALAVAGMMILAWFALRAGVVGSVWHVYGVPGSNPRPPQLLLWEALQSFPAWWHAQAAAHTRLAAIYGFALLAGAAAAALACRGAQARMVAALAAASAGLLLATWLNVGLHASGEGGRNFYAPLAWFAIACGIALAGPAAGRLRVIRGIGFGCAMSAAAVGSLLLHAKVEQVLVVQHRTRAFAAALDPWAAAHPGLTMVIVAESEGPVVSLRNAQGAMALPPVQARPLLHRTLPTLPREIATRYQQFARGLATRLEALAPEYVDAAVLAATAVPDRPSWPQAACWSAEEQRLIGLPAFDPADEHHWIEGLTTTSNACRSPAADARP